MSTDAVSERTGARAVESLDSRLKNWVLLEGPRSAVVGIGVGLLFGFTTLVGASPLSPFDDLQPLYYAFGGLTSGNLTIVTVVVSINQLLLSRELKAPDELRSQMEGVVDYRDDVEASAGRVAPVEPLGFLRLIYENTREDAQRLGGISRTETTGDVAESIDQLVAEITRDADQVDTLLREGGESTFHVLSKTLATNYARDINRLRRIRVPHGDRLPDDVDGAIEDLIGDLRDIDVARQYFKAIYLQQELAALSRFLVYTGLPSVAVVATGLFVFTASGGSSVSRPVLTVLTPAILTVGLLPLVVLCAFILRSATVTRRTAATLPFTAPAQEE